MEEEDEEEWECEKRGRRVWYEGSSEDEESRDESEWFGPGWNEIASAGAGTGSWNRTVRLGLGVEEDEDVQMEVWAEERPLVEWMEDWSVLAYVVSLALPQTLLGRPEFMLSGR